MAAPLRFIPFQPEQSLRRFEVHPRHAVGIIVADAWTGGEW